MNTQKGVTGSVIVLIIAVLAAVGIAYYFMNKPVGTMPKEVGDTTNVMENEEKLGASAIDAVENINYPEMEEIVE